MFPRDLMYLIGFIGLGVIGLMSKFLAQFGILYAAFHQSYDKKILLIQTAVSCILTVIFSIPLYFGISLVTSKILRLFSLKAVQIPYFEVILGVISLCIIDYIAAYFYRPQPVSRLFYVLPVVWNIIAVILFKIAVIVIYGI